ncbi:hypothetical protein BDF14DRAFT_1878860 [Spinellus fusiger]|nr:hypothetical protein BDF14DRAFT_1878860 [Spinellus fusiger]
MASNIVEFFQQTTIQLKRSSYPEEIVPRKKQSSDKKPQMNKEIKHEEKEQTDIQKLLRRVTSQRTSERFLQSLQASIDLAESRSIQEHKLVEKNGITRFRHLYPRVYVVNNVDNEKLPEYFRYVSNLVLSVDVKKPDTDFLEGCHCKQRSPCCDTKNPNPCHEVNAYNENGCVTLPPRTAIYECNLMCRCNHHCKNRVVQRGRTFELEIFKTKSKGWGVRALTVIPANAFVEEYIGEVIKEKEGKFRSKVCDQLSLSYLFNMDIATSEGQENTYVIDAFCFGNVSRFFNHSCQPNLQVFPVFHDSADLAFHRLAFFALRDIHPGEELTLNYYGERHVTADKKKEDQGKSCLCGEPGCCKWIL